MDISIAQAHNKLSDLLKKLKDGPITITRRGKPVGVIITPEDYENLRHVQAYLHMVSLSHKLSEIGVSAQELYKASRDELEEGK